jgi:hypothetical protein
MDNAVSLLTGSLVSADLAVAGGGYGSSTNRGEYRCVQCAELVTVRATRGLSEPGKRRLTPHFAHRPFSGRVCPDRALNGHMNFVDETGLTDGAPPLLSFLAGMDLRLPRDAQQRSNCDIWIAAWLSAWPVRERDYPCLDLAYNVCVLLRAPDLIGHLRAVAWTAVTRRLGVPKRLTRLSAKVVTECIEDLVYPGADWASLYDDLREWDLQRVRPLDPFDLPNYAEGTSADLRFASLPGVGNSLCEGPWVLGTVGEPAVVRSHGHRSRLGVRVSGVDGSMQIRYLNPGVLELQIAADEACIIYGGEPLRSSPLFYVLPIPDGVYRAIR